MAIHIYTGEGKGKSTACVGLALRMVGAGRRIYFAQFMKSIASAEMKILMRLKGVVLDRCWDGSFILHKPSLKQRRMAQKMLARLHQALTMGFDMVVADEIMVAFHVGLLSEGELLELMECAGKSELVLSGVGASEALIKRADLVTHMRKVKHYYDMGQESRLGIEY